MNEILSQSIFFGIAITLVTYEIGLWIKQKTGKAIANPLLISVILIPRPFSAESSPVC